MPSSTEESPVVPPWSSPPPSIAIRRFDRSATQPSATGYRLVFRQKDGAPEPASGASGRAGSDDGPATLRRSSPPALHPFHGDAAAHIGRVIAGKYEIRSLIGQGGAGSVFEAEHMELQTAVALKLMHPEIAEAPESARRFQREARAASRVNHPNVVRVLDAGCSERGYYVAMERLRGNSLRCWIDASLGLPPIARVAWIVDQLLSGLEVIHRHGIVHRDLKPQNLFMALDDAREERLKVLDFGLAQGEPRKAGGADDTLMSAGVFEGTPEYMSPEQCQSGRLTAQSDLYAVGCVLTELLQKRPPFSGGTPLDVMTMHVHHRVPRLSRHAGAEPVPEALEALRRALLAKQPEQRPRDAAASRRLLAEALGVAQAPSSDTLPRRDLAAPAPRARAYDVAV